MEQPTNEFTVISKSSNETIQYVMTSLNPNKDLLKWAQFCEPIFSYKPNPPSSQYFERHVQNDPLSSWIRVILSSNKDFAASVQTCQRRISSASNGTSAYYNSGGIANVVTCPNHRQRGLVKKLLHDSLETIMIPNAMDCSLLHCSPTLIPVYQSCGYKSVITPWKRVPVSLQNLVPPSTTNYRIRRAKFPEDTTQLQTLHQHFSEENYVGCIIRSIEYWNQYIANEIGDKLYVLTSNENIILAWMAFGDKFTLYNKLLDFGMDTSSLLSISDAMGYLFHNFLIQQQREEDNNNSISVSMPTSIWEQVKDASWILNDDDNSIMPDDDEGWMYKMINPNVPSMIDLISKQGKIHLIWPADSSL